MRHKNNEGGIWGKLPRINLYNKQIIIDMVKRLIYFCALMALVLMGCEKPLLSEEEEDEDVDGNLTVTVWQSGHEPRHDPRNITSRL